MTGQQTVRLSLPSKGRMEEETTDFFHECGLRIRKTNPRQYSATIPSMPEILVLFERARDVARSVGTGDVDLGITGMDTVVDALGYQHPDVLILHEALEYGQCALVMAIPEAWDNVDTLVDLTAKAKQEGGLRIATKHTSAAAEFLQDKGLSDLFTVVSADGALEVAPTIGYADMIIDITSTGTTLRENHLKVIDGGILVESQAVFIGNRKSLETRDDLLEVTHELLEFFEANLRARGQYLVFANMRGESGEAIAERLRTQTTLGGLQGPTIAPVYHPNEPGKWWSVSIVLSSENLYRGVNQLRSIGGSGVVVTPATYIFDEKPMRYQRLLAELNKEEALA